MFQVLLPTHESHVRPVILMLARALERMGVPSHNSVLQYRSVRALARIAGALNIRRLPCFSSAESVFAHLNHPWSNAFFPYALRHPLVTYSFDLWPHRWDEWQRVFDMNRPAVAFISAKVPMAEMQRRVPDVDFRWLPEAVELSAFDPSLPLTDRPVDLTEIGRPFKLYHERIRPVLAKASCRHEYPNPEKPLAVPNSEMAYIYSRSKIVPCFPRSVTHPELAGNVETTTCRYFECMASRTLMVGHCPQELIDLLGYNPVIEAHLDQAGEQLVRDILPRIGVFQKLVDRNIETLRSTWTVDHQAQRIRAAMSEVSIREAKSRPGV